MALLLVDAIKIRPESSSRDEEAIGRLRKEARRVGPEAPNILTIYEIRRTDGDPGRDHALQNFRTWSLEFLAPHPLCSSASSVSLW